MPRRVLIISPHFPPVNAPDMQRVRMLLPFFERAGWQVEVLAIAPEQVAASRDPWLVEGLPKNVRVHRINAMALKWSRIPGFGSLALRAFLPLLRTGDRLLAQGDFDLVYFSTTVFEIHWLGCRWMRKFGVPFAMDYQDPWVSDYYDEHPDLIPPGGRLKFAIANALHRWMEPRVLKVCSGISSTSPAYPEDLKKRYSFFGRAPILVQSFPGAKSDFARLQDSGVTQNYFDPNDGNMHWVYTGVLIAGMDLTLKAFFRAIATHMQPEVRERLRLHFLGTSYAPAGKAVPVVAELANESGLAHLIHEECVRIPFVQTLRCLSDANAIMAIGSNDPGYTASKIYPYLLARKPLLAIYHEKSSVIDLLSKVHGGVCVPISEHETELGLAEKIAVAWLDGEQFKTLLPLEEEAFHPHTDEGSAITLCSFWEDCLAYASK
jgi:Glycosyl transferase 4-like domain